MGEFDAIRPYNDAEVPAVMERLLGDQELMRMLAAYRFPLLARWFPGVVRRAVQFALRREARGIQCVDTLQHKLEPYLDRVIESSTLNVTYSGLDNLRQGAQFTQLFGLEFRHFGIAILQRTQNFDPFDGINAQIGLHIHLKLKHFDGIARFIAHDFQQRIG